MHDLPARDAIVRLGKLLAEEQRQGYHDHANPAGLDAYMEAWHREAAPALNHPGVREAVALLHNYGDCSPELRQRRLDRALERLRDVFRTPPASDALPPASYAPPPASDAPPPKPARKTSSKSSKGSKSNSKKLALSDLTAAHLTTDITHLAVMQRNAAAFKRLGVQTVEDLLYHLPHRYDDFTTHQTIAGLHAGDVATLVVRVIDAQTFTSRQGRTIVEIRVQDDTGTLRVTFFGGGAWLLKQFSFGRKIVLSGKVGHFQGVLQMSNPDWEPYAEDELVHTGRLVPVHPLTKGLHEKNARAIIKQVVDHMAPLLPDHLPAATRERCGLLPLGEALQQVHFPDNPERLAHARTRLAFDEFLLIQLGVLQRRMRWQAEMSYPLPHDATVHADLLAQLPFSLTGAQQHALTEIFADIAQQRPMARLLQGDVGSGKTVVAAAALLQAIANGLQGALMAPTEILAEQHYKGLRDLLRKVKVPRRAAASNGDSTLNADERASLNELKRILGMLDDDDPGDEGVRVALLTGSLGAKERRRVYEGIRNGELDLVIGTHALITDGVSFQGLGLVCIDEQHRFGVEQRERLKQKGFNPHMLVMTATPIPRTLTLTIYGELDTSILNELPPGRQPIKTRWISTAERHKAYKHMRREIEQGRQAFVICPLVEESEKLDVPSAEEMAVTLQADIFPDLRVGLIHGRLLGREKDDVMRAFRDREFDILVATAVVEVGIDIPNASTIVIEGAERFGLAQLHQFRGRVGRGSHQSYCILVSDAHDNEHTQQRLGAMEETNDGFRLAEIDLELRGPGEFLGRRQSGTPDLKAANLADTHLLVAARNEARTLLDSDPDLAQPAHRALAAKVAAFWRSAGGSS